MVGRYRIKPGRENGVATKLGVSEEMWLIVTTFDVGR